MAKPVVLSSRTRIIAVLRLVMVMAMCGMALPRILSLNGPTLALLVIYILTSVLLFLDPVGKQLRRVPQMLLFTLDLLVVVLLMFLSGGMGSEFFIMFFLIILMAALARSASAATVIAFISAVLYGLLIGIEEPSELLEVGFTTRVAFFFVTALFAGYLAEEVDKERAGHHHFKSFYRTLFEESAHGILVAGVDGVVQQANPCALQMLGRTLVGASWRDILRLEGLPIAPEPEAAPSDGPGETAAPGCVFKVELSRPDQEPLVCEVTLREFTVKKERYVLLLLCDVGSTVRMQDRMLELEKMSVLGKLVSSITHEINNPLTVVLGWAEMLGSDENPAEVRECAQAILEAGKHCKNVVEGTLNHFRSKTFQTRPVAVGDILRAAARLMEFHARYHLVNMQLAVEGEAIVIGDAQQLEQLLINLMSNSVHALKGSSVRTLKVRSSEGDGKAIIEVSDTGAGMPEETRKRLFQPGFTTKVSGEGHGLGLSLSREIVQRHGGKIGVESRVGKGTTFTITLPLAAGPGEGPRIQGVDVSDNVATECG